MTLRSDLFPLDVIVPNLVTLPLSAGLSQRSLVDSPDLLGRGEDGLDVVQVVDPQVH